MIFLKLILLDISIKRSCFDFPREDEHARLMGWQCSNRDNDLTLIPVGREHTLQDSVH